MELAREVEDRINISKPVYPARFVCNPDAALRDLFLNRFRDPNYSDIDRKTGLLTYYRFNALDINSLERLLIEKMVDPHSDWNGSPTIKEIYLFMKRWPGATASGVAHRSLTDLHHSVGIDGLEIPRVNNIQSKTNQALDKQMRNEFKKLVNRGDVDTLGDYLVRWD